MDFITICSLIFAILFALNMGASGTAPSMSVAYGSGILPVKVIPGIYGVMVFLGASAVGWRVIKTLGKSFIPPANLDGRIVLIIVISCTVCLFISNLLRIPQSTSQVTVASIAGAGIGIGSFNSEKLPLIFSMWIVLPLISFLLAFLIAKSITPRLRESILHLNKKGRFRFLEFLIVATSCYVAFAIGSNNVANAVGPLSGANIVSPFIGILLIAPYFGIGSAFLGRGVLERTGKELIDIGILAASLIGMLTATLLIFASLLGIPQSLVQLNVSAIIGVGCARHGIPHMSNHPKVRKMLWVWVIAPILAILLSYLLAKI